jgi:hypothetical protein
VSVLANGSNVTRLSRTRSIQPCRIATHRIGLAESEQLNSRVSLQLKPRLAQRGVERLSIFALGPQALRLQLGYLISDIPAAEVYQLRREPHPTSSIRFLIRPVLAGRRRNTHVFIAMPVAPAVDFSPYIMPKAEPLRPRQCVQRVAFLSFALRKDASSGGQLDGSVLEFGKLENVKRLSRGEQILGRQLGHPRDVGQVSLSNRLAAQPPHRSITALMRCSPAGTSACTKPPWIWPCPLIDSAALEFRIE